MRSFKRITNGTAVAVFMLSSLMSLSMSGIAHAATTTTSYKWTGASSATAGLNGCASNCWSVAGNWDTSTDGVTWATATTAPKSTDNSGAGDNLVFDNSILSANLAMTNDIASLTVGNISTKSGTGSFSYSLGGTGLTVTGGVASQAGSQVGVTAGLTFSGNQAFGATTGSSAAIIINGSSVAVASGTLTINANYLNFSSLAIASGATVQIVNNSSISSLSGSGALVVLTPTGSSTNFANTLTLYGGSTASTFSGSIDLQKGAELNAQGSAPENTLGTAALTIEDGAQLYLYAQPNPAAETGTINLANAITMGGNGAGVDQMNQGAIIAGLYDQNKGEIAGTLTVNLTGAVTLSSNTSLASVYATAATYNFTGALNQNGHSLSAVATAQPTYGNTTVQINGKTVASSSDSASAPKTPDTGFALTAAKPGMLLGVTTVVAVVIFTLARVSSRKVVKATTGRR